MAFSFQPKMITDGLVFCFDAGNTKSYPGSGTIWSDLSSTAITGSLTNGPTFNSANGGSIIFDGTNDFVDLGNRSEFAFTSGRFSIEAWVFVSSSWTAGDQYPNLISKGATAGWDTDGWSLFVFRDRPSTGQFTWGCGIRNGATRINPERNNFTVNQYHHIVATLNGTTCILYEDGVQVQTASQTVNPATSVDNVFIAKDSTPRYLPARIPIVKLYNRALSATEVLQNYNALKGRFGLT